MDRPNENGLPTRQHRQPLSKQHHDHTANQTQRLSIATLDDNGVAKLIDDLWAAEGCFGDVPAVDEFFDRFDPDELFRFVRIHVPELLECLDGGFRD